MNLWVKVWYGTEIHEWICDEGVANKAAALTLVNGYMSNGIEHITSAASYWHPAQFIIGFRLD